MMKVLYISYDGMTDPLGQSQVLPYLRGLSSSCSIWLLSYEKPEQYAACSKEVSKSIKDSGINWIPRVYRSKPPVLSTLWDIIDMRRQAHAAIASHGIDFIHCRSYISALVGLGIFKSKGIPYIFDMRGFWADERVEGGIWDLDNYLYACVYKFFKKKELEFFAKAAYTVSLTNQAAQEIHSWPQLESQQVPIKVIPCCADLEHFKPQAADTELKNKLGIMPGSFVVGYLGSTGTWYLLREMFRMFTHIKRERPGAVFLFVTKDSPGDILRAASAEGVTSSDIIVRSASRAEVPSYLSVFDVSLSFIKQSFSKKASSPTKLGEIMGMGVPVICNSRVGDVGLIMDELGHGSLLHDFSDQSMQQSVSQLGGLLALRGAHIRSCAEQHFSLEKGIELYADVYRSVYSQKK
jgi:hypothetical protein